jgi:hypothetical protein
MKRNIGILLVSGFALVGLAFAQQQPPAAGNPPNDQRGAMRAVMEKYRPWFDLSESLSLMQEVDKQKGLEFSKAQVKIGLPVLTDLSKRATLATKDATKILDTLETKFVSAKQLIWMDKTRLAREEERRKRAEARRLAQQGTGQTPNVGALAQGAASGRPVGAGGFGTRPGGANGQAGTPDPRARAMFDAMQNNKPFNPFKSGVQADELKKFMALLAKR